MGRMNRDSKDHIVAQPLDIKLKDIVIKTIARLAMILIM